MPDNVTTLTGSQLLGETEGPTRDVLRWVRENGLMLSMLMIILGVVLNA